MPGNDWLASRRNEAAADRILDAAEELYTQRDSDSIGMNEIARAAGCSRATLYRYFENREALRPLLEGLPERERTVLVLRFFDSMTQTQIAERVGISQMHVSRLLAKSLTRLRDELE